MEGPLGLGTPIHKDCKMREPIPPMACSLHFHEVLRFFHIFGYMLELNREIWQCFEKNYRNLATRKTKIKNKNLNHLFWLF